MQSTCSPVVLLVELGRFVSLGEVKYIDISISLPRTQMTLVLIGKALVSEG